MQTPLTHEQKKQTGTFYTPYNLAQMITEKAIHRWLQRNLESTDYSIFTTGNLSESQRSKALDYLAEIRVLDPSVGDGVFLIAAAESILNQRKLLEDGLSENELKEEIVTNNLFGVDIRDESIWETISNLLDWAGNSVTLPLQIKQGNGLVGFFDTLEPKVYPPQEVSPFHWYLEFPDIMIGEEPGFDIILGNPPYGNILSSIERDWLSNDYGKLVASGRDGTWNAAALFIARAGQLLSKKGELGFLVPNSILRVRQFTKTRKYLMQNLGLWGITDEGSPFSEVTLEMVTLHCSPSSIGSLDELHVNSRRENLESSGVVPKELLTRLRLFPIYYDGLYELILQRGETGLLKAVRGRDLEHENVSWEQSSKYLIPYITKGGSVKRYKINNEKLMFANNTYQRDAKLKISFEEEFLVATKNFPHPRCIIKPKGIIHGGGIVRIHILDERMDPAVIGLILNSRLIKYISIKYLTNYSELTTCLNTGIMEEIPIVYPKQENICRALFKSLQYIAQQNTTESVRDFRHLDSICDALVYQNYFFSEDLADRLSDRLGSGIIEIERLLSETKDTSIIKEVNDILSSPLVRNIESSPRM